MDTLTLADYFEVQFPSNSRINRINQNSTYFTFEVNMSQPQSTLLVFRQSRPPKVTF